MGERSVRHREDPQDGAGWGSPIYVPAEEMVLHEHVLHPFLQWLLLLLLQDDTETRVSAPHPEKGRSCLWAEPKHAEASRTQTEQLPALPTFAQLAHGEALWIGEHWGKGACHFHLPQLGRAGSPLCQHCHTAPAAQPTLAGKAAPSTASGAGSRGDRGWAEAQSWEREAVSKAPG